MLPQLFPPLYFNHILCGKKAKVIPTSDFLSLSPSTPTPSRPRKLCLYPPPLPELSFKSQSQVINVQPEDCSRVIKSYYKAKCRK